MAFEALTEKFSKVIKKIKGESHLSEKNMDEMLKEVRIALLEADVNYKVVRDFVNGVKEKAIGEKVFDKLNPSEMVIKIVRDELVQLLGSDSCELTYNKNKPTVILLVGLQGSGKTTTAGKLAYLMKNKLNKKVLLAACDVYRPAAIDQLDQIAKQINVPLINLGTKENPVNIALKAKEAAFNDHYDVLIIDTAGRLQIDEALMDELKNIKGKVEPDEILLLTDAMAGQDSVNVAKKFNEDLKKLQQQRETQKTELQQIIFRMLACRKISDEQMLRVIDAGRSDLLVDYFKRVDCDSIYFTYPKSLRMLVKADNSEFWSKFHWSTLCRLLKRNFCITSCDGR